MNYYRLYDIDIASEIELPSAYKVEDFDEATGIVVSQMQLDEEFERMYKVRQEVESKSIEKIYWLETQEKGFYLGYIFDAGLFRVSNGKKIAYHKIVELDTYQLEQWILNMCIPLALIQREDVLIHCSALVKNGRVFMLSGDSGSGKSTLADELLSRNGFSFMSDDTMKLVFNDGKLYGYGAYPLRRLCKDAAIKKGYTLSDLIRIDDNEKEKYGVPVIDEFSPEGREVSALFILNPDEKAECVNIKKIEGASKLMRVISCLYKLYDYKKVGIGPELMKKIAMSASELSIYEVTRPTKGMSVKEIAERIDEIL